MAVKYFVLDTNVLLHNADSIHSFADNIVVLPMSVIEELDNFKTRSDELGRNARRVIRDLDQLRLGGSLSEGVPLANGGTLRIGFGFESVKHPNLDLSVADNRIVAVAYTLKQKGETVNFVSKDINARLKADALGIPVQDFEKQKVNVDELYSGYREIIVPSALIDNVFSSGPQSVEGFEFCPNEFVLLQDEVNLQHTALAKATSDNTLVRLVQEYESAFHIHSRSKEQRMALELLLDPAVSIVTLVGQAGTGKTLLALAAALELTLNKHLFEKILVSRPIIPMGKDLGYMPGDKDEKLRHWMQPIFDNLTFILGGGGKIAEGEQDSTRKQVENLLKAEIVEMEALTYIRGRSISNQFVIIDEAQNLTPHEVKTIISRAGSGTKMVLTGDPDQIDNPYLDYDSNGLMYTVERLKNIAIHGHITLRKSERSELAGVAADYL
ncbi:MAG: PhoH family protein [Desulfobulbaceae bacterium]|jgi:PhoH-like ATPase|nr:PhoH family protein [Desulfobulbaceae bacterium]